jgi:hypothetical protein
VQRTGHGVRDLPDVQGIRHVTGPAVWNGKGTDPWLPYRLDAALEAASTERQIRAGVWAALSEWLVALERRMVREGAPPDLNAVWAVEPAWRDAVDALLSGEIWQAIGLAFRKLFGVAYTWDTRPAVVRYFTEVRSRLVRIPEEVYDLVAGQLSAGINLGEGIPELSARVDSVLSTTGSARWSNRATVIARTECLPGETIVNGAYATSAYRRLYSGPMVTVETMGGRQFTGTPNHPVLTPDGWVGLGALLQGDHLVCDSKSVQTAGTPGDCDIDAGHATIAQVFDAAQAVGVPYRERTAQPDFHGDGQDGYVDILRSFGVLPVGRFAPIDQRSVDLVLPPADAEKVALACLRAPFARSAPVDQPASLLSVPPMDASLGHNPADGLKVCPIHGRESLPGIASLVALQDFGLGEVSPEGRTLAAAFEEGFASVRQRPSDLPLGQNRSDLVAAEPGLVRDLLSAQPGEVELDEVVSIEVSDWSGHVYNLTTVHGYFVSGGIYTGNTIGALNFGRWESFRAIVEDDPDTAFELMWLATDDKRTRETHVTADGQRVPVGSRFIVGGAELAFPGDPSGPPQEVIQCRCTMLLVEEDEIVELSNRQMR